ncbi:MAG: Eco57I restriction-modification methylase domain-containing protein [Candidatus Magasanikbacteria bacterium]|nr:Eco57I restriction-modification methylase domain-containing protein [Candidatus Magasanikbacteria bacterium]
MINPIFSNKYNEETFAEFIQGIIPSLSLDKKRAEVRTGFKSIQQIAEASENKLDLVVFVAQLDSSLHARVEITKNTYAVLKSHARSNALVAYISDDSSEWRLSLITTKVARTKDGTKESISNPRRFSYVLGPNAKVATPSNMLRGTIDSIIDLENKFSLAVVSKEFFTQIATQYSKLVGGTRGEGRKAMVFERTLKLGDTNDAVNANFAIRLIGRLVFCWFLKQKKGHLGSPLIPSEILSVSAVKTIGDYYHSVCVPLFFEVLNKPQPSRPTIFSYSELFDQVPFLNGGLFQDHTEDNHKFNRATGMSERRGVVIVPDIWFSELFQVFEEYNFTIDENTSIDTELSIDPEMLGRIFENLLAEVNPETGASARKSTGSFYTPREIVDFMVEESLIAHLKTKTNISEEKLRALSSYDLDDDTSHPIDQQEQKLLVEAIHNTTVLDPACGSGAFPIGVLQRLVHMLGVLDPECSIYLSRIPPEMRRQLQKHSLTYVRKLGVIRECIHGVDIQPVAIDISRLRCFLTLVVDQQVDDDAPNRGIEPLPNLDFKFVCANTLIKPPVHEGPLFGDEFADALGELIDEYFAPVDQLHKLETARKLQQLISEKTNKELESIIKSYSYLKDEKHKQALAQINEKLDSERIRINSLWKSYENIFQNKPVGFFDTRYFFPVVFRGGGFDIVIGNPPYVRQEEFSGIKPVLKEQYGDFFNGRADLYTYFIARGTTLLKERGILSFITSNKFFVRGYGENTRALLTKDISLKKVVNFGELPVFQASVDSAIVLAENTKPKEKDSLDFAQAKTGADIKNIHEFFETKKGTIKLTSLGSGVWSLQDPEKLTVLNKIKSQKNTLGAYYDGNIFAGLKTGLDGVYVITRSFRDKLINADKKYEVVIKPWLRGKDVKKWNPNFHDLWVINLRSSSNFTWPWSGMSNVVAETIFQSQYPILYDYLIQHKKKISKRSDQGDYWWELRSCAYDDKFNTRKIIYPDCAKEMRATYDETGLYGTLAMYIVSYDPIIMGILNSKLFDWYSRMTFATFGDPWNGGRIIFKTIYMSKVPVPDTKNNTGVLIKGGVDKILAITKSSDYLENSAKKAEVKKYEEQIDKLVYELYDLKPEEIEIVENLK